MKARMGNNREAGLKGDEGVENYSDGNELEKIRNKIKRGSRITLTF